MNKEIELKPYYQKLLDEKIDFYVKETERARQSACQVSEDIKKLCFELFEEGFNAGKAQLQAENEKLLKELKEADEQLSFGNIHYAKAAIKAALQHNETTK